MDETSAAGSEIQKELQYYKKQLDRISGEIIRNDFVLSSLRHELKQKKEAFAILTSLQKEFSVTMPLNTIFAKTVKAINTHLEMDRSILFTPASAPNTFKTNHWHGFPDEQIPMLEMREIEIPSHFLKSGQCILLNKATPLDETSLQIRKNYTINYFIGVPILLEDIPIAFIVSGRQLEKFPFKPSLDKGDADTLLAIAGLISTVIQNKKMMELRLQMKVQLDEKNEIINIFGQQVSKDVAQALINAKASEGAKKNVAVMFLDIRNFTPFVQNKPPEETIRYLNSVFGFMTEIIHQYKGIVNQFLGDGFMTTFGAPVEVRNPFQNAVDAALEIHKILQNKVSSKEVPPTKIGIGIHGGEAVIGNIGSALRKQYTITGNVVIIAARIEQLTKHYNADILISGDIYKKTIQKDCPVKNIGEVSLKGLSEPIELYQLI